VQALCDSPDARSASWSKDGIILFSTPTGELQRVSQAGGVPVCVTVTHMDGFVLARSDFHHSINYRAVMAFGTAAIVDDAAAKRRALDHFVDGLFRGRSATLRPTNAQEFKATTLCGMTIEEAAAVMDISPATVKREWAVARAWLYRELSGEEPAG